MHSTTDSSWSNAGSGIDGIVARKLTQTRCFEWPVWRGQIASLNTRYGPVRVIHGVKSYDSFRGRPDIQLTRVFVTPSTAPPLRVWGPYPKPCHHQRRTLLSKSSDLSGPPTPPHQIRIHDPPMRRPRRLPLHQNPRTHLGQRPHNANLLRHAQISPPPDRDTLRW